MTLAFIIYLIETVTEIKVFSLIATIGVILWFVGFVVNLLHSNSAPVEEGYFGYGDYIAGQKFITFYKKA